MSAAGFEGLVGHTGPGDLSKLIALRALVDRVNGDGTVERANWLTGVREEYQRWYARHAAHGHPENFPADETLRYLDEHIVRTLAGDGVLQPVVAPGTPDGPDADGELPWHAVRLSAWAAAEVDGERDRVLDLLDTRIRTILEHTNDRGPSAVPTAAPNAGTGLIDLPPAPQMDGPAMHESAAEEPIRPGEMLVPGGATLSAKGLVKVYRKRRVVNEVDLHVSQGEIVGLLGPNGAGKTTSFYMMTGLIRPDKGRVFIGSRDLTGVPMYKRARAGIGYLAQEPSIFRKLTVEENVMAILQMMKIKRADRKARLEQLLDELSIKHLRKTRAYALSGGERRRLEITRALVGNPKFMLLDEPFAGVDPIAVHDIQQIVSDLRRRGIGVLISDHNVEQTLDIVDRAYIMYDGRVRVSGTVGELVWNEEVAEIYLGPTLTARMRERYPNPALERPHTYGEPADGAWDPFGPDADDPQWEAEGAWGADAGPAHGGSADVRSFGSFGSDGGSADRGSADGGPAAEDRPVARGGMADDAGNDRAIGGYATGRHPADDGSGAGASNIGRAADRGWNDGGLDDENGRPRAAAEGTLPVRADDDDGEHGGADGRTGDASQG
jgi:lipopolysaccharide export system ATP-binding protein